MFNFDEASAAWRANKIPQENGTFAYKCNVTECTRACHVYSSNNKRKRKDTDIGVSDYCRKHILLAKELKRLNIEK